MTTISSLVLADHDDWIPLWQDYLTFYESELPDEVTAISFARLAERDGMYGAIARDDRGRAVGFVNWTTHSSTWNPAGYCYLEDLFVAPDARGVGIGQALIAHVRDWADTAAYGKVYWLTQETNAVARAMYDRVAQVSGFVHYEVPIREREGRASKNSAENHRDPETADDRRDAAMRQHRDHPPLWSPHRPSPRDGRQRERSVNRSGPHSTRHGKAD